MLKFTIKSNSKNNTEVKFETNEIEFLLEIVKEYKHKCSPNKFDVYETIVNKVKALCLLDKQPDEQSQKWIQNILLPSDNITKNNIHNIKIRDLPLTKRTFHCLDRANIKTLGELLCLSKDDLLKVRNLGTQSLNEIVDLLNKYNLKLSTFQNY